MNKPRLIFLSTNNSARSQMAEAFMRKYAGDRIEPHSAGLTPKPIHPYTIQVMDEIGVDLSGQSSKGVETYLAKTLFTYLISVCDYAEQNCPTAWLGIRDRIHWTIDDPDKFKGTEAEKLLKFRQVRDHLQLMVKDWLRKNAFSQ